MRTSSKRLGRPSTSTTIAVAAFLAALAALVLSMGNPSSSAAPAKPTREEVQLLTTATGSAEVTADGESVSIPLTGGSFTQEADTTLELVTHVTADFDPTGGNDCNAYVAWQVPDVGSFPDTQMAALGQWMGRDVFGITPVSTARTLTLHVDTNSDGACQTATGGVPTYRVDVEVAVLALR